MSDIKKKAAEESADTDWAGFDCTSMKTIYLAKCHSFHLINQVHFRPQLLNAKSLSKSVEDFVGSNRGQFDVFYKDLRNQWKKLGKDTKIESMQTPQNPKFVIVFRMTPEFQKHVLALEQMTYVQQQKEYLESQVEDLHLRNDIEAFIHTISKYGNNGKSDDNAKALLKRREELNRLNVEKRNEGFNHTQGHDLDTEGTVRQYKNELILWLRERQRILFNLQLLEKKVGVVKIEGEVQKARSQIQVLRQKLSDAEVSLEKTRDAIRPYLRFIYAGEMKPEEVRRICEHSQIVEGLKDFEKRQLYDRFRELNKLDQPAYENAVRALSPTLKAQVTALTYLEALDAEIWPDFIRSLHDEKRATTKDGVEGILRKAQKKTWVFNVPGDSGTTRGVTVNAYILSASKQ